MPSFLYENSNVFSYILTPQRFIHKITYPLATHCPIHRVNPFRTAELIMQRVNSTGSWVFTSQTALSPAHRLLRFVLVSIQIVSVLGWIGPQSMWTDFLYKINLYSRHQWKFLLLPLYRPQSLNSNKGRAIWGPTYSTGPNSIHTSRDSGLVDRVLLCCKFAT